MLSMALFTSGGLSFPGESVRAPAGLAPHPWAGISPRRSGPSLYPRPDRQHPFRHRRASRRCGSARWSGRSRVNLLRAAMLGTLWKEVNAKGSDGMASGPALTMILETLEVHNSPNSRLFGLRPTVAAGFLGPANEASLDICAILFR